MSNFLRYNHHMKMNKTSCTHSMSGKPLCVQISMQIFFSRLLVYITGPEQLCLGFCTTYWRLYNIYIWYPVLHTRTLNVGVHGKNSVLVPRRTKGRWCIVRWGSRAGGPSPPPGPPEVVHRRYSSRFQGRTDGAVTSL